MVDDPQNKEVLLHASVEGTPRLKFHCREREVGEHVGYSIEPVLKQKKSTAGRLKWSHVFTTAHFLKRGERQDARAVVACRALLKNER